MEVPPAMPQAVLGTTDHQTPKNGQNASTKVTLELRKYILLLASLVATVTYAAGFSPPGDVWQDTADGHLAGDPIIRDTHHRRYVAFFYCNATAFAASLVVIVITLTLAYLDDNKDKHSGSKLVVRYTAAPLIPVRTLQAAMVLDLLSLMGAYAAGTCRDTFTTVYSSVLVAVVVLYLVFQVAVARYFSSGGTKAEAVEKEEELKKGKAMFRKVGNVVLTAVALAPASSAGGVPNTDGQEQQEGKENDRFRKVLMLLATFAVSVTYSAGLSTPGGFWDAAGAGHVPGDPILKDRHGTRLAVFFGFNTMAFGASLLIIVVLLDTKLHARKAYVFIVVALVSLIGAYSAGSCRETDTTLYVSSLIAAVLLYIGFLYSVADHIHDKWEAVKKLFRTKLWGEPPTPSTRRGRENTNGRVMEGKTEKQKAADQARSLVLLLATLAATITYQAGLDPPGGVWQDNSGGHMAGDPILLTTNPRRYKAFFYCNSVSLVASLVAIVLVQRKLLLKRHVLEAVMILDLFGLIGAYAAGSCRDVNTSIHAMALAGAVLVYVVVHVIFITLDDGTHTRSESDNELVEKTRKRLLLFAILAATITYQAGLTPPGGFLLQDDDLQSGGTHHAGDPVLLCNFPRRYKAFFYCNSVSFMLSIALIVLLVNPNLYRPAIRTHALSVCTAAGLFGLLGAYAAGSTQHIKTSVYIFVLIAVVLVCIALLFLVFLLTGSGGGKKSPWTAGSKDDTATSTTQGAEMEAATQVVAPVRTISDVNATTTAHGAELQTDTQVEEKNIITNNNTNNTTQDNAEVAEEKKKEHAKRKYLMVLGILVASVTYQAGLKPPGRAWQSSGSSRGYEAGNPVMHDNRRPRYLAFFYSNSTSFMASIVVILLLLIPQEKLFGDKTWHRKWIVVMNTTIVLDLLGVLGAYAAGSSRRWKTSGYVLLLVIGVLVYMAFHLLLSRIIRKRNESAQLLLVDSSAKPEGIDHIPL